MDRWREVEPPPPINGSRGRRADDGEGGIIDDTLAVVRSQHEALEFLAEAARSGEDLSLHFIRQLHQLICREQETYEARDRKKQVNHVVRKDGTLLEYTPPEHVQSQMEHLIG